MLAASIFRREYRFQQVGAIRIALEVRVAKAAVIVEPYGAEPISLAHDQDERYRRLL